MVKLFIACLIFTSCASVQIPDFKAYVTLPASGDGFYVKTVSDEEGTIPKAEWDKMRKRGIIILSDDWAILRNTMLKNCLSNKSCTDTVGVLDNLFYSIDQALLKTKP